MAIFISKLTSGKVKIEICDHYKKYGASTVQPPVTVYSNLTIRSGNNQTDDQDTAPVEDYQASAVCNGSFATFISCLNYMMANYENEFPNGPHKTKVITYTSFANYAKYLDWLFLDVSVLALQAKDIRFCLNRQNLRLEYALEIGEHCV
jgi:hypothetical protein